MMNRIAALALGVLLSPAAAHAAAVVGADAPDFSAFDTKGKLVSLYGLRGKYVVLEWLNKDCPFVKKHYGRGNMQNLQKNMTGRGIVWLSIVSSAKGKQGFVTGPEADAHTKEKDAAPTAVLLDPQGRLGRLYGAKTTPHMFVIDKAGVLRYAGAIDSNPSSDPETIASAENYVLAAVSEMQAQKKVTKPTSKPYGCSVKY